MTGENLREVVARRREFLDRLTNDAVTKPELVATTDASRSTIDRAIDDLLARGLVERDGSRYEATVTGELVLAEFETYHQRLADIERAHPVLSALPDAVDVEPAVLAGADVHVTKPVAPEYPIRRSIEVVERADRMRGYGPVVIPQYVEVIRSAIVENDLQLELIFTPEVFDRLEDAHEELQCLFAAENTTIYRTDDGPLYALWQAETPSETHSGLLTCNDDGVKGAIVNDTEAMNEWARATYDGFRETAREVEAVGLPANPGVEESPGPSSVESDAQSNSPVDM